MSEFHVVVTKLDKIERHPNADTLELSTVCGYPVIFKENQYSPGDKVVYVPTDSLVPADNPLFNFLVELDAFDKPKNVREGKIRVKAKKLRGVYSIGLIVPIRCTCKADERGVRTHDEDCHLLWTIDQNVQEALGITKWEPHLTSIIGGETERDPGFMPVFTDIESLRKYEHCLRMDEEVVATEKIHGSNARFVYHEDRLWVGSHYQFKREDDRNIYWKVARQRDLATKLATIPDIALYGEVYGHQKGFDYGLKPGEVDVSFFDAYDVGTGRYYDYHDFRDLIEKLDLPFAPILHLGVWDPTVKDLRFGNTLFNGKHIREGFVVRPIKERYEHVGRVVFKMISEEYHLRNSKE